jgi:O-antigen ligase
MCILSFFFLDSKLGDNSGPNGSRHSLNDSFINIILICYGCSHNIWIFHNFQKSYYLPVFLFWMKYTSYVILRHMNRFRSYKFIPLAAAITFGTELTESSEV